MKKIVKSLSKIFGFDLVRKNRLRIDMNDALKHLKDKGFRPKTVIDVGVAYGTPELYSHFPKSKIVLVEPIIEFEKHIRKIVNKYDTIFIPQALSSKEGSMGIHVRDRLSTSSLYEGNSRLEKRTISVTTLEKVFNDNELEGPYLLKVDVEGAEIDVVEGLNSKLDDLDIVILEVTYFPTLKNAPDFTKVLNYMNEKGFTLYDIFNQRLNSEDGLLSQSDITFINRKGDFYTHLGLN